MGLFGSLIGGVFGAGAPKRIPERRTELQSGFFWHEAGAIALAAGRGFNQSVVGESFYRDNLRRIAGGKTIHGVNVSCAAELRESEFDGKPCLEVWIQNSRCGAISQADLPDLLSEFRSVASLGAKVLAKGRVSAGYENGDYCVQISVSRPLKEREPERQRA